MLYGLDIEGSKVRATPKANAICPLCEGSLIAKCGQIKQWHWAHRARDCDSWYEPESEWHLNWKQLLDPQYTEVVMKNHRADILTAENLVIELQNSSITVEEITEREAFYGKMIWIFNAIHFVKNLFIYDYTTTGGLMIYNLLELFVKSNNDVEWKSIDKIERQEYLKKVIKERLESKNKLLKSRNRVIYSYSSSYIEEMVKREDLRLLNLDRLRKKPQYSFYSISLETPIEKLKCPSVYLESIRWKHLRASHLKLTKPFLYDLGYDLMLYSTGFRESYKLKYLTGYIIKKNWFISNFLSNSLAF